MQTLLLFTCLMYLKVCIHAHSGDVQPVNHINTVNTKTQAVGMLIQKWQQNMVMWKSKGDAKSNTWMLEAFLLKIWQVLLVASDPRELHEKSTKQTAVQNRVKQWQDQKKDID